MIYFLLLTALTVSIDSLVCGFSLSLNDCKKLPVIIGITLVVFILCTTANYLAILLSNFLTERLASLGGIILIAVGVFNLFKKQKTTKKRNGVFVQSIVTGFAVGLDGAFATLSLSIMGMNAFYVPLTMTLTHAIMITLGVLLAKTKLFKNLAKIEFIPPLILILLGGYKLLGLFI